MATLVLKHALSPRRPFSSFNFASFSQFTPLPYVLSKPFPNRFNSHLHTTSSIMSAKSAIPNPESAVTVTSATPFLEAIQNRRSLYALNKDSPISNERIQEIIKHVLLHVPSSFNSQPVRAILLVGDEHTKLWGGIVKEALRAIVPAEKFAPTEVKIDRFNAAYGTVLFFDDRSVTETYQKKFAIYAEKFPNWATESNGMHQFAVWTALEAEGLGANIQHYDPLIDAEVQQTWNVPEDWVLRSQLVFGGKQGGAGEKAFKELDGERFFVHGA